LAAFHARFHATPREVGLNMTEKPSKPYASYPLYAHAKGSWAKKILGKVYYFGPWSDPNGALESYLAKRDYLRGGFDPPEAKETVGDLVDAFLAEKRAHLETGDIASLTFKEYETTCNAIRNHFGRHRPLDSLAVAEFSALRVALSKRKIRKGKHASSKPLGVASLKRRLTIARMIFAAQPLEWRKALKAPPRKLLRERTRERGKQLYTAAEIRKLAKAADPHLRAIILLGINCAFGPKDCCTLPTDAIDGEWHNYHRTKTGVDRRCPLWPETIKALKAVAGSEHVFNGRIWTRHIVAREFVKLCEKCKVRNLGHYSLRRTFETIATTASVSQAVIDHITGHARNDMASVYRQQIFDQQLRACSDHVREWYLGNLALA
jgi:integrase